MFTILRLDWDNKIIKEKTIEISNHNLITISLEKDFENN